MKGLENMPDHARIWVYQANRKFSAAEEKLIRQHLDAFTGQWAAHGKQLLADYALEKDQFIIVAVDESTHQASGCSIDASVAVIRKIEQETGLNLLDRTQVAFMENNEVRTRPFNQLKQAVLDGEITLDTRIFNNTVTTASEWKRKWIQPAGQTWLNKYFG